MQVNVLRVVSVDTWTSQKLLRTVALAGECPEGGGKFGGVSGQSPDLRQPLARVGPKLSAKSAFVRTSGSSSDVSRATWGRVSTP